MQSGLLNELIEIYKPVIDKNEYGEQVQVYVKFKETKAQVIYNSGNRSTSNNEIVFNYYQTFKIRRYHEIMENYQIKYKGKFYRILSIEDIRQYNHKVITTELINE
jgi:head-tail adaptor